MFGVQVTYLSPDTVVQHGLTTGAPVLLANLPKEQILDQVVSFSSDRVNALYLRSSNGTILNVAGSPTGTYAELDKAIFGFYGATKDGVLVSLGFYTLIDFTAARARSRMVGGVGGNSDRWDDSSSYNGDYSPPLYCCLTSLKI